VINLIATGDDPKLGEIEMSIPALEWVKGPGHNADAGSKGPFTLCELQLVSQVLAAILRQDGKHVGVKSQVALFPSYEAVGKTDQPFFIEGADQYPANLNRRYQGQDRDNVSIGKPPYLFLQLLDGTHFGDFFDVSIYNV
jgi:hypothetical protein